MKVMGSGRFTSLFVRPVSHPAAVPFHSTLFSALRSGENPPGTGPAASVSRSTARYTHLASLVPLGRVSRQGRSLPRASPFPPLGRP